MVKEEMKAYLRGPGRGAPEGAGRGPLDPARRGRGGRRAADRGDILGFFQFLLAAGTETTTNLIDNAILCFIDSPAELFAPPGGARALALGDRGAAPPLAAADGVPRDEARRRGARPGDPGRKLVLRVIGSGEPGSAAVHDPGRFDIGARSEPARRVRPRHPFLHRGGAGAPGGADRRCRICSAG